MNVCVHIETLHPDQEKKNPIQDKCIMLTHHRLQMLSYYERNLKPLVIPFARCVSTVSNLMEIMPEKLGTALESFNLTNTHKNNSIFIIVDESC